MELKKAACIAARNTAKGKKNDTKKAAKVIGVAKWGWCNTLSLTTPNGPRRRRMTVNGTNTTPNPIFE